MSFILGSLGNVFADKVELKQCVQRKISEQGVHRLRVDVRWLWQRSSTENFWLVSDADYVQKFLTVRL